MVKSIGDLAFHFHASDINNYYLAILNPQKRLFSIFLTDSEREMNGQISLYTIVFIHFFV